MRSKNLFILIVAVLLAIALMASASALIMSGFGDEPHRVSVIVDDSSSGRWTSFLAGLEQAAKDYNIKLNIVSTSKNMTLNQQFQTIEQEIDAGAEGIIIQFNSSTDTEELISEVSRRAVIGLVETNAAADVDVEGKYAYIGADNIEIGKALASEVRLSEGNRIYNKKIGLIEGNQKKYSMQDRKAGFLENIETSGAEILWIDASLVGIADSILFRQNLNEADILVALDNNGLEAACEYAIKTGRGVKIFGAGCSIKNVSYLDDGLITSMIVPNEYYMGYQSLAGIAQRFVDKLMPMENENVAFRVVNRDSLFDDSNQRLLFPVVQ